MKDAIVLYPSPGTGHLSSTVELGRFILTHQPSLSIHVIIAPLTSDAKSTAAYIEHISPAVSPSITFHHLPTIDLPPALHFVELSFEIPRLQNPNFLTILQNLSDTTSIKAVVLHFFTNAAFHVSTSLNIPTYYFHTTGGSGLATLLYFPTLHETIPGDFKDLQDYIQIPGTPPIFCLDMPDALHRKSTSMYKHFLSAGINMRNSAGFLTKTFEAFETRAIDAVVAGNCVPNGPTPPFYGFGPLIASRAGASRSEHECLSWLDSQPTGSVVFLSFGRKGLFSRQQLKDMASGLENSGHRFLWVVRNPPPEDMKMISSAPTEPDLDTLLPKGFLERTRGRGLVVKSWAPQADVLSHGSVGGFLTHCGWNSVLEGVCAGVPMLAWPLYAEQRMNRVFLVEELKVALWVKDVDRFVSADELEERVRELMDGDGGKVARKRVKEISEAAKVVTKEGGTARVALAKFVDSLGL